MKRFFVKLSLCIVLVYSLVMFLIFIIPKDENSYMCEYNHKVELIEKTAEPRIIFIGGSSVAFGTDSKRITDSLHRNAINLGLHAGMGIKIPTEDFLQYVRKGDVVVLQIEYENFYGGGNGDVETVPWFLYYTGFRTKYLSLVNPEHIIWGFPRMAIGNLRKIIYYPFTGTWKVHSLISPSGYEYSKGGFNEYGDEVGHYDYPSVPYNPISKASEPKPIDESFIKWLKDIIIRYEQRGAQVIMLPPVCIKSHFARISSDIIENSLKEIDRSYIVNPETMVLEDKYTFDTEYHVSKDGVKLNTQHIIESLANFKMAQ